MRGLWLPTFSLCVLAFSVAAISLAATLVSVSHSTSCHAHFVGSRLLGFLVNLCAAVIIAVVAATAAEAAASTALYKVATNNWPDTQATSVHLSISLSLTLFFFLSLPFSLTHSCKNMRASGNHRLPLLIIVIVAAACIAAGNSNWQLLLRHSHAHRPSPRTPRLVSA